MKRLLFILCLLNCLVLIISVIGAETQILKTNGIQRRFMNTIQVGSSDETRNTDGEIGRLHPRAGSSSKNKGTLANKVKQKGQKQGTSASRGSSGRNKDEYGDRNGNEKSPHGTAEARKLHRQNMTESELLSELFEDIFSNYHRELVPKRPTFVKMDLLLMRVKSTVEKEGIFESVIALLIEWEDARLRWNPLDYANISVLAFDSDKVWLPDIAMTNSADHLYTISKDTRFVVRVLHDGSLMFVPTGTSRTWCDLKLLTFPFDIQTCGFEFESWALDSSTMTFNESSNALIDDTFASPQWALCQHRAVVYQHYYQFSGETFTRIRFQFAVKRKPTFYVINLIFPCATLSAIQLLGFTISSTDTTSDRVGFGTTNLLTLVVFQTIITQEMPKSSDAVTALSKYVIALIIISSLGILQSVVVERVLRMAALMERPPPHWLMRLGFWVPLLWEPQLPTGVAALMLSRTLDDSDEATSTKTTTLTTKTATIDDNRSEAPGGSNRGEGIIVPQALISAEKIYVETKSTASFYNGVRRRAPVSPIFGTQKASFPSSAAKMKCRPSIAPNIGAVNSSNFSKALAQRRYSRRKSEAPSSNRGVSSFFEVVSKASSFFFEQVRHGGDQREIDASKVDDFHCSQMIHNAQLWGILMTKVDIVSLLVWSSLALAVPLYIFAPLALTEQCALPPSQK